MKFLVDFMLGKLARELRMLGFDVKYIQPNSPLVLLQIAKTENRTILSRNTKLKDYPEVLFIESEIPHEQIKRVLKQFNLEKEIRPFSRCIVCNELLQSIDKPEVKGRVPFFVFQTQKDFSVCPQCQKIYWRGSHWKNMQQRIKKILK
ncbi:MAG: Mut7-C RNAse domain-containing protein [candidate division WOR-3 bacterium]|nr:Mut7-C RNAse domain-containing protein [candidate division WOR-3 bacterium]